MNNQNHNSDDTNGLEDAAIDWLVHLQSGTASDADRQAFAAWRQRSDAHEAAAYFAETLWTDLGETQALNPVVNVPHKIKRPRKSYWLHWLFFSTAIAASLVLAFVTALGGLFGPLEGFGAEYVTQTGERREIQLADGSSVWLNSASALSTMYTANQRRVELLVGEGYFTVAPDPERPFQVQVGEQTVTALGTAFSVRHVAEGMQIVVTEHAVVVGEEVQVNAGQSATVGQDGQLQQLTSLDAVAATAWIRGKLIFQAQPLEELVAALDRQRFGRIVIMDEQLARRQVSGVFPLDDPDTVIEILQSTFELEVTRLPFLTLLY